MKTCSICQESKCETMFWIDRRRGKPKSVCKSCSVIQAREWRRKNPDYQKRRYAATKKETRERHLIRKYGITLNDYNRLLKEQDGRCWICKAPEKEQFKSVLHVDHDHENGEVRGLLCRGCNHMLGVVGDDTTILERAISYLSSRKSRRNS